MECVKIGNIQLDVIQQTQRIFKSMPTINHSFINTTIIIVNYVFTAKMYYCLMSFYLDAPF